MAWGEVVSLALPPQVPVDMDQPTKQTESMLRNQSDGQKLMRTVHRSTRVEEKEALEAL